MIGLMTAQILVPIIASVLYVIVFQKAGMKGPILAVCAGPVLAVALVYVMSVLTGGIIALVVVSPILSLLPLAILAFKSWPPVAAASSTRSES